MQSPVAIAFDERGRMYVCEMFDYPFDGKGPHGRIRLLEDTHNAGRFDKSTIFADDVPWPTGITCYDGGVFVCSAPDILYLKSTTGAGKADIRKVIFTGFGRGNVQGLFNSLAVEFGQPHSRSDQQQRCPRPAAGSARIRRARPRRDAIFRSIRELSTCGPKAAAGNTA